MDQWELLRALLILPHLTYEFEDRLELFKALPGADGEDKDECVAFGNGESLHGWELVRSRCVCDVKCAYRLV